MSRPPASRVRGARAGLGGLLLAVTAAACSSAGPDPAGAGTPGASSAAPTSSAPATTTTPEPAPTSTATSPATPARSCAQRLVDAMTPAQRAGQLVMVGAQAGAPAAALDRVVTDHHVGGVVLLGSWSGGATVAAATAHWQTVGRAASGGPGVLVAADQEGGQVRHVRGSGFTATPSALAQGRAGTARPVAATTARELAAVGVQVDLAPVADTVAAAFAPRNAPIGALQREFGNEPAVVSRSVVAAVEGLQSGGVSATLKHFPGLGRVTGNTDTTASGTTDATTTADDAYLEPFRAGVGAGADLVMVSSARYPRIDAQDRAPFSRAIVTDLLRDRLGFRGVVVSDDLGGAAAVADVSPADRATRFVAAGGDVVLTGLASTVPAMAGALRDRAAADPAFAAQVDAAAARVVELKTLRGLAAC